MFQNNKNIILFWIIFMGRAEALFISPPIRQRGGAVASDMDMDQSESEEGSTMAKPLRRSPVKAINHKKQAPKK